MSLPSVSTGPQIQPKYKYLKNIQEKKKQKPPENSKKQNLDSCTGNYLYSISMVFTTTYKKPGTLQSMGS